MSSPESSLTWQFGIGFDLVAVAFAVFGVLVALDLVRRHPRTEGALAWLWLAGAALALGTGAWALHFVALAARPLPIALGHGGVLAALGWAGAVLGSAWLLREAYRPGWTHPRVAVACLGAAMLLCAGTVGHVVDLGLAPAPHWNLFWLAGAASGLALGLALRLRVARWSRLASWWRRALAAAVGGGALFAAGRAVVLAAHVPIGSVSLHQAGVAADGTMALLAVAGGGCLLAMLAILSLLETRMRAALRRAIERVEKSTRVDPLTQLPNRVDFDRRLDRAAEVAERERQAMAVMFIGLDQFKPVNDLFGRRIGDRLLQVQADRLRDCLGPRGEVARIGGDEFVVLVWPGIDRDGAAQVAQELLNAVAEPCDLEGRGVHATCSIGIALFPRDGTTRTATAHAEAAARFAKRHGGATFAFFEPSMLGDARDQVELLRDLREAVNRRQLELFYQPKVHAPSGEINGCEALLRWHHPKRGMVSPAVFIPIAERHGLIASIGAWVIDETCRQAREWRDRGLRMRIAMNLSAHQLRSPDLADRIGAALRRHGINPDLLTCEITESVAMEDADATRRVFEKLAAIGVHLSIDDFGTGYCNFAMLRKLPAEELKIDRSFVCDVATSADARAVVDAVVKLAQALGRKVVAEGVETEAQARVLCGLGCDVLQGFLYAKPMSAKALALWASGEDTQRPTAFRASLFAETQPAPVG